MKAFVQGIIQDVDTIKSKVSIVHTMYKEIKVYYVKTQIYNNTGGMIIPILIPTKKKRLIYSADMAFKEQSIINISGIIFSHTLPTVFRMKDSNPELYNDYKEGKLNKNILKNMHLNGIFVYNIYKANVVFKDFRDASYFECIGTFKDTPKRVTFSNNNNRRYKGIFTPQDSVRDLHSREIPVILIKPSLAKNIEPNKFYDIRGIYYTKPISVSPTYENKNELVRDVDYTYLYVNQIKEID